MKKANKSSLIKKYILQIPAKSRNSWTMCGITFVYRLLTQTCRTEEDFKAAKEKLTQFILPISKTLTHRGPDESGVHVEFVQQQEGQKQYAVALAHERLSIIDLHTGRQPLFNEDKSVALVHNGEIYNHEQLRQELKPKHKFYTKSDSESIIHTYEEFGPLVCAQKLDGDFAYVLYDHNTDTVVAARDRVGVKPLFIGKSKDGSIWFSSEIKPLQLLKEDLLSVEPFLPGYIYVHKNAHSTEVHPDAVQYYPYFEPDWFTPTKHRKDNIDLEELRQVFHNAVQKRLMSDVPLGLFLSGGLDSSIVGAVTRKLMGKDQVLHSFSIGIGAEESQDLQAARRVADFLKTTHHERIFTIEEGIKNLENVIYAIESYDVTSIRASTAMYLLSQLTKDYVKVVLSGEGSDEMFAGYAYFADAESAEQLQGEMIRKVRDLFYADVLRADRSTAAWGLETRVPFLDRDFLDTVMTIDPREKMYAYRYPEDTTRPTMEKYILRHAFEGYLPYDLLWRIKVQFSDGVGHGWIDNLIKHASEQVSDEEFAQADTFFPHNTPKTKEAFYYRKIYSKHFPYGGAEKTIKKWLPWCKFETDPSGRFQRNYEQSK